MPHCQRCGDDVHLVMGAVPLHRRTSLMESDLLRCRCRSATVTDILAGMHPNLSWDPITTFTYARDMERLTREGHHAQRWTRLGIQLFFLPFWLVAFLCAGPRATLRFVWRKITGTTSR